MDIINNIRRRPGSILMLAIPVTAGAIMLALSWLKWPDLFGDFGRELYIPWQINNGAVLYRDIAYLSGPFSPYLNAMLFKLFGTGFLTLVFFNICLIIILAYMIYRFFLLTTDKIVALAGSIIFLTLFAFSQYSLGGNYNFVCPYSHDLMHGVFLSFTAIYVFLFYLAKRKIIRLGIIGILIGAIFLTKAEAFVSISLSICAATILLIAFEKISLVNSLKMFGALFGGWLIPVIGFAGFLSCYMPVEKALSSILFQYKALFNTSIYLTTFYSNVTGLAAPLPNLIRSILSACWYIVLLLTFGIMGYILNRLSSRKWIAVAGLAVFCVFILLCAPFLKPRFLFEFFWKGLPPALIGLGIYFFLARKLPMLIFTMFSFLLLMKIILNVHIYHYGYALAMPGTLLLAMLFAYHAPRLLGRIFGNVNFMRALGLSLFAVIIILCVTYCDKKVYRVKTLAVGTGQDTIMAYGPGLADNRDAVIKLALDRIGQLMGKDDTLIVFPDGVMINYLSRHKNSCPYIVFMPPELKLFGEEVMLDSLKASPPDYILLAKRDTREYGYTYFGLTYGTGIFNWIKNNYTEIEVLGNPDLNDNESCILITRLRGQEKRANLSDN